MIIKVPLKDDKISIVRPIRCMFLASSIPVPLNLWSHRLLINCNACVRQDFISNYNAAVVGQLGEVNNIKFTFSLVFGIQYNQNKERCA